MRFDKFVWVASVATFALVAVVLLTVKAAPSSQDDSAASATYSGQSAQMETAAVPSSEVKMPSLFDFEAYKRLFKKKYSGFLENVARFKYFTSRALRASISAIKYRFRLERFHLSINHMSDMSPSELDLMRNKVLEEQYKSVVGASAGDRKMDSDLGQFIPDDDENVVAELRRLIDDNAGKPEYEALRAQLEQIVVVRDQHTPDASRRRKREIELNELGPRELPLSKLINVAPENPDSELPEETRAKIRARPKSNNPLYEPIEVPTEGLRDQQVPLQQIMINRKGKTTNTLEDISSTLNSLRLKYLIDPNSQAATAAAATKLPDEVFIDLRKSSNCLFAARGQGKCGSCYAFAVTAVAEWLHCHATGELVALSEQYMVDCGKEYQADYIDGCEGGLLMYTNGFFHNFGWELRSAYPYMTREQQCPYSADTDLRKVGYLRANMRNAVEYDIAIWPDALKAVGPLAIQMNTGPDFREYGSGIYDKCVPNKPTHAVVLIGHGREDGEEYWLIRNSHSVGWGEAGHVKLSKRADCISPRTGWSWGSDDGFTLKIQPEKNPRNDGKAVQEHYKNQVINSL